MRTGRPSSYTAQIGERICERIASGETLTAVCKDSDMPSIFTVLSSWLNREDFGQIYARAKQLRLEVLAEELRDLSDQCREGIKEKRKQIGWVCPQCQKEAKWQGDHWVHSDKTGLCVDKPERVFETEITTGDMVERAKLQVDTRKWLLARLAARTYGDRVELAGDKDAPLNVVIRSVLDEPKT